VLDGDQRGPVFPVLQIHFDPRVGLLLGKRIGPKGEPEFGPVPQFDQFSPVVVGLDPTADPGLDVRILSSGEAPVFAIVEPRSVHTGRSGRHQAGDHDRFKLHGNPQGIRFVPDGTIRTYVRTIGPVNSGSRISLTPGLAPSSLDAWG
jgi:hypothetical protein